MISIPVYDRTGQKLRDETIDPADFGGKINKQLLHDVVLMHRANRRVGTVNTRGRADVAGSGKKLFRQKGTGNARARAGREKKLPRKRGPAPPRAGRRRTKRGRGGGSPSPRRNRNYSYSMPKRA